MSLYLTNATWIDPDTFEVSAATLKVEEGPFGGMAKVAAPPCDPGPEDRLLDCSGRLVTRAFGCAHHHIYSALARGMPPAPRTPTSFPEILEYVWWRMDKKLDHDMIEASALVTGLYCAKNGATFVIDHHASPFHAEGSLETIAKALDRVGLGHLLCYEMSCRDGEAIKEKGLAETDAYLSSGRKGHVGLHASFTVDDDLLRRAVDLARKHGTGIHIHVAEGVEDQEHCARTYGKSVGRRLADAGVLDLPLTILGHCVHLDEEERDLIRTSPCWVVQNTESNLNNKVGLGRYNDFPRVMLGTDGMHSDMIRSAQASYFIAGLAEGGMSPEAVCQRLRAVHRHIADHGAPGNGLNNLVVFNYDTPTPLDSANFPGHFCYAFDSRHVETVISQGKVIVDHGALTSMDEADILAYANEQARRLWALLQNR